MSENSADICKKAFLKKKSAFFKRVFHKTLRSFENKD